MLTASAGFLGRRRLSPKEETVRSILEVFGSVSMANDTPADVICAKQKVTEK
jgi:hypothetical protein